MTKSTRVPLRPVPYANSAERPGARVQCGSTRFFYTTDGPVGLSQQRP